MSKLYCVSDIHGFYNELRVALDKAGFDPNNKNHFLISCGDEFDRGPNPKEVMNFLNGLKRKVIIRGNHTQLFEDLCLRGFPEWYDERNGTRSTVEILGNYKYDNDFELCCERAFNRTKKYRNNMVNYFETKNYIFVHSFLPLIKNTYDYSFNPDWRDATQEEWDSSMWRNPFELAEQGFNQTDKTLIFGHWHCSTGWATKEGRSEFGYDAKFDPYYGNGYIGIDSCCAYTHKINVLKIEDDFIDG